MNPISLTIGPLSNRDKDMLDRAMYVARASTCKQRHGALIYKSGRVIGVGVNVSRNSHPTMEIPFYAYSSHAEVKAIDAVYDGKLLQGATIYVARINKSGDPMNSLPCRRCMLDIESTGIKRIVHT